MVTRGLRPLTALMLSILPVLSSSASEGIEPLAVHRPARWMRTGLRDGSGNRKYALILGASRFVRRPSWNLPHVQSDILAAERIFREGLGGFEACTLQDADLTLEELELFFTDRLPLELSGEGNLLLIYYSGYNTSLESQVAYFTYTTDRNDGRFTDLLIEDKLAAWIRHLQKESDVRVVCIMETCIHPESPMDGPSTVRMLGDASIIIEHPTGSGLPPPDRSGSAFTSAFCRALSSLAARTHVTFLDAFTETRSNLGLKRDDVGPRLLRNTDARIVLQDNSNLGFTVKVIDGLTDVELPDARVTLNGENVVRGSSRIEGLEEGVYLLSVEADGYLRRHGEADLSCETDGLIYEVPLYPRYALLEGTIRHAAEGPLQGLTVESCGFLGRNVPGYHTHAVPLESSGRFRFVLPQDAAITGIRVMEGPRTLYTERVDPDACLTLDRVIGGNRVSCIDLGTITVAAAEAIEEDYFSLTGESRWLFDEAEKMVREGRTSNLDAAIASYMESLKGAGNDATRRAIESRIQDACGRLFRYYLSQGFHARGAAAAWNSMERFPGNGFFLEWRKVFDRENIPGSSRKRLKEAGRALDGGDFTSAERIYSRLLGTEELTPYYRERVAANLKEIRNQLFKKNFALVNRYLLQEHYEEAVAPFLECRALRPAHSVLDVWVKNEAFAACLDKEPPDIFLLSPADGNEVVNDPNYTLRGRVRDNLCVERLTINGQEVFLVGENEGDKTFSLPVELSEGDNWFLVMGCDKVGCKGTAVGSVTLIKGPVVPGFAYLGKQTFACGGITKEVMIYLHKKTGLEFVLIPGGRFYMGSSTDEKGRESSEGSQRTVTVKPFLLCRTECTQAAWDCYQVEDERYWNGDRLPIENVSWEDCVAWCERASLRLPTEAEWEFACRGGCGSAFCFGGPSSGLGSYAWYSDDASGKVHSVGLKKPNAFGLYDMHGNVLEWCRDRWHDSYSGVPSDGSPWETGIEPFRVIRGGSWFNLPKHCRSASRKKMNSKHRSLDLGFRPAKSIED